MTTSFVTIAPEQLDRNPFDLFAKDWPLLTAGHADKFNGMTIGWGGLGVLWRRKVATVYVRHQRYTFEFIEREPYFSLSFLDETYKPALRYFGEKSGRDVDKVKETGLTPVSFEDKTVYFEESRLVLIARKLYADDFEKQNFTALNPDEIYAKPTDYHRLYIGEVVSVLRKQ